MTHAAYIVTDWLGHALYRFATEAEAREYVQRYQREHVMYINAATKWDRVPVKRLADIIRASQAAPRPLARARGE